MRLARVQEMFFKLATGQEPTYLWIGCSDSRVPENKILGVQPGEVFVHRNVANVVAHADTNLLSVLTYAIEALSIRHILVVGHYDCGGVRAAMNNQRALGGASSTVIDNWLTSVRDVYRLHADELDAIEDPEERHRRLVEKNVVEQCLNVFKTGVVQHHRLKTFHNKEEYDTSFAFPRVHALVFDPVRTSALQLWPRPVARQRSNAKRCTTGKRPPQQAHGGLQGGDPRAEAYL